MSVSAAAPPTTIRALLVDDHDVVREGLAAILEREADIEIVGSANSGERALTLIEETDPDVVVLDYRLPGIDGLDVCREIAERRFRARVVILSAFLEDEAVYSSLMAGASAYVVKDVEAEELKHAIRVAARGETVIDPKVAGRIVNWAARLRAPSSILPPSQAHVLRLLCQGKSNDEIARLACLSRHTVKSYLREIYRKLGVSGRSEAAATALRRGLV